MDFQPIGCALGQWTAPAAPGRQLHSGVHCTLVPADAAVHAAALFAANNLPGAVPMWTYLPYGPFENLAAYEGWMRTACLGGDPLFFAVVPAASGTAAGLISYLRIDPRNGVLEIGHLAFSPGLQKTAAATEAVYLLIAHAFSLGYRRVEWKCDALHSGSRAAALRLGFRFEGIFRQAVVYKKRNRDTAWFSIIDGEWPRLQEAFQRWLDPVNFTADGKQRSRLSILTASSY